MNTSAEDRLIRWLHYKNWFYYLTKFFILNFVRMFWGLRVHGVEHIPREGGVVIAANHISSADPPILGICIPRTISYMAKKELFEKLGMRIFITALHAFPIDRSKADMNAVKEALRRLKAGNAVGIFIQGTRNAGDAEAMNGAAFLAQRASVPIVPAAIRKQGKGYIISFGAELSATDKSREAMQALTDETMNRIHKLVEDQQIA